MSNINFIIIHAVKSITSGVEDPPDVVMVEHVHTPNVVQGVPRTRPQPTMSLRASSEFKSGSILIAPWLKVVTTKSTDNGLHTLHTYVCQPGLCDSWRNMASR